jgi:hypothetical protein
VREETSHSEGGGHERVAPEGERRRKREEGRGKGREKRGREEGEGRGGNKKGRGEKERANGRMSNPRGVQPPNPFVSGGEGIGRGHPRREVFITGKDLIM